MAIIEYARIAERIDSSPTERLPQIVDGQPVEHVRVFADDQPTIQLPRVPAGIAGQVDWAGIDWAKGGAGVDLTADHAPLPTCPSWCRRHSSPDEISPDVSLHGGEYTTIRTEVERQVDEISVRVYQVDDERGAGTPFVEMGNQDMTPAQARQLAAALLLNADVADGNERSQIWAVYDLGRNIGNRYDIGKADADRAWTSALTEVLAGLNRRGMFSRARWALRLARKGTAALSELTEDGAR